MNRYILLLIAILPVTGWAQESDFSQIPQIRTNATYTTEVVPDRVILSITISEQTSKGKVPVEVLEQRLESALAANGIDIKSQLRLVTLSSNFRNLILKKADIYKTKNFELEVKEAGIAGKVLKDLETQNIANVNLKATEYSKLEELKIELKAKAVLKAKKQAEEMTKALGQKLGNAIFISDLETNLHRQYNISSNSVYQYKDKELDKIKFDNIRVQASVMVYFRLE